MNNRHWTTGALLLAAAALPHETAAAIPDAAGVIHACYNAVNGALRVIDTAVAGCRTGETPLQWNAQGAPGLPGADGAPGAPGPQGPPGVALAWAHVRADGTVDQASPNITVAKVASGVFCVGVTNGPVRSAVATIDSLPNRSGAVQVGVFHASGCPDGATDVFVVTRENAALDGLPGQDKAFYLLLN